jgi:hypothetical protein
MQCSGTLSNDGRIPRRGGAVGNLLFFRRSCAYRNAAVEMMRKARACRSGQNDAPRVSLRGR